MRSTETKLVRKLYEKGYSTPRIAALLTAAILFWEQEGANKNEDDLLNKYADEGPNKEIASLFQNVYYHDKNGIDRIDDISYEYTLEIVQDYTELTEFIMKSYEYYYGYRKLKEIYKVPEEYDNNSDNVQFTFEYRSIDGSFSYREKPSRAVVVVNGSNMSMLKIKGVDPTLEQTACMCLAAAARTGAIHKYSRSSRVFPYKINNRIGYSGCEDYFLDLYYRDNSVFIKKCNAAKLHISMAGKIGSFTDMYVGDILELLTAALGYEDFEYCKRINKKYGVRFVRQYRNEIVSEEEMDFVPKRREGHRRPSRRR